MVLGATFDDVLAAARTGAEWAWTNLYRDLAPAILGYVRSHGAPEPEDITSEVFVSMVRKLGDFEGSEEKFRSWVFVIAHRRMQDEWRKSSRRPAYPTPDEKLDRPAGDAEAEAMELLATAEVRDHFAQLSPEQRDVLLLRLVADLPIEEVGHIVGRSVTAVKALQRRGLAKLARILEAETVTP